LVYSLSAGIHNVAGDHPDGVVVFQPWAFFL